MTPKLFQPFTLKSVTARNRVVVSPMCQYASENGSPTDWHIAHLGRYGIGGAGIIFHEDTAVELRGRKTAQCSSFHDDAQVPAFRRISDFIRSFGAVPAMQLGHSGSKSATKGPHQTAHLPDDEAWERLSPSPVPSTPGMPLPREMSEAEIGTVIANWAEAARRTHEAGFDILEIHGGHGYLIQQFLSPITNRRTDGWGGDLAGRMRFALEVTQTVRAVWPEDKPLFFRISAVDGKGGIWGLEDSVQLALALKDLGVDLVDCSSGGIRGDGPQGPVPRTPGYHVPYARRIKAATGLATMAPGFITQAWQAEALLEEGDIDLIGMARELMANSEWPVQAAVELGLAEPFSLLPPQFNFRLADRARSLTMEINQPGTPVPG